MSTFDFQHNSRNYTIAGLRIWLSALLDETNNRYSGYRDLGNVVSAPIQFAKEDKPHFTARSGERRRDKNLSINKTISIPTVLDEWSVPNLMFFFGDQAPSQIASAAAQAVTDEIIIANENIPSILSGYNPAAIVVKDITDTTTYVLDTDYSVVDIQGGYKGIKSINGGGITEGDALLIDYNQDVRAAWQIAPFKNSIVECKVRYFITSTTGQNFIFDIEKAEVQAGGDLAPNAEDYGSFTLQVDALDNSANDANFPFGRLKALGKGTVV